MKVYLHDGDAVEVTAPYAVSSGEPFAVGSLFGVAGAAAASGAKVIMHRKGQFRLPKLSTDANAPGEKLNWNATNKNLQEASGDLNAVATVVETAAAATTSVVCVLTAV